MATRVVEGKKPYTGGKAISIDENKVISLNLRDENNLIIYDSGDDEIYVDLQLPDGIQPTDAFPIGVTTGRVLVADDWDITGTIICAKTTSGDNIKLLYGDDGTLWIDNGTGTFKQIYFKADVDALLLALRNYIDGELAKKQNGVSSITAPANSVAGDLWYDTANDRLMIYDGTSWNLVGGGGGGGGSGDVLGPSSAVDGHLAVFDGTTGKLIKDGGAIPTIPTNVSDFNNDAGYITGITSGDVTTALGYTPYNSTNPAGYLTSSTGVTTFNGNSGAITYTAPVSSVNSQTGAVTLDADDISDSTTTNKFVTASDKTTWGNKQDALTLPATPTQGNIVTWGASNKTLVDGGTPVVSGDSGVTYTIKVANSDPASGTASNIITLVP